MSAQPQLDNVQSEEGRLREHLEKVQRVMSEELVEGVDYSITDEGSRILKKPGAEKLMVAFNLGVASNVVHQEVNIHDNFACFTINCDVFDTVTGEKLASGLGIANSQESKYRNLEAADILNTLIKIGKKRAIVDGVILAVKASEFLTQDEDEIRYQRERETRNERSSYRPRSRSESSRPQRQSSSRFGSRQGKPGDYEAKFGKYIGVRISAINVRELEDYVAYLTTQNPRADGPMKEFIDRARDYLRER